MSMSRCRRRGGRVRERGMILFGVIGRERKERWWMMGMGMRGVMVSSGGT